MLTFTYSVLYLNVYSCIGINFLSNQYRYLFYSYQIYMNFMVVFYKSTMNYDFQFVYLS